MNDNVILAGIFIGFAIIVAAALITGTIREFKKEELKWLKYKLDLELLNNDTANNIREMLDSLIEYCFERYMSANPDIAASEYIPDNTEITIRNNISNMVSSILSESMYNKLTLYYNKNILPTIIAEQVYLRVTAFVVKKKTTI